MVTRPHRVTRQEFRETARRRAAEARSLLDHPAGQRRKDGAVTCALLAAECALKALLLDGHGLDATDAVSVGDPLYGCFRGAAGHDLPTLARRCDPAIAAGRTAAEFEAIDQLHGRDRYAYRYGAAGTGIDRAPAAQLVAHAETLVAWMNRVLT